LTVKLALNRAREILDDNDIQDSALESELLLRHTLGIDRVQLYLALENELSPDQSVEFQRLIRRRLDGEPTAYITGCREFYGLDFYVDSAVLIPRPESELLVEKAIELVRNRPMSSVAEVGTGCGAIAVSLALNLPQVKIYTTEISASALEVARFNCRKHGVEGRICLLEGNMLEPLPELVELIVANLPYVREAELTSINTLGFEPSLALNGGPDGLDKIRHLCRQAVSKLRPGGCLLLEIGQGQGEAVTGFLHDIFPTAELKLTPDLSGIDRVVNLSLVH